MGSNSFVKFFFFIVATITVVILAITLRHVILFVARKGYDKTIGGLNKLNMRFAVKLHEEYPPKEEAPPVEGEKEEKESSTS